MNKKLFRLVFNQSRGVLMAVSEIARTRFGVDGRAGSNDGPEQRISLVRPSVASLALAGLFTLAAPGFGQTVPAGALPEAAANFVGSGDVTQAVTGSTMTLNQASQSAILNWNSFNIGADAAVRFVQPNAAATVLNRIFDANPSIIQGQLSANGQVYLINQNGIIFANGAQINVGSLIASTLDIPTQRYLNGLLSDNSALETFVPEGFVRVENGATLTSAREGRIVLLAPKVSSAGSITARDGQIILAAGSKVLLSASQSPALRGLLVEVEGPGVSENLDLGRLIVDRGNATLAGLAVNQSGRVSASTSVVLNGSVRLLARNATDSGTLTLGTGSRIEVLPDSTSTATIQQGQPFTTSSVELFGKTVEFKRDASIYAPGGNVTVAAQTSVTVSDAPRDDARVYMAEGSSIDVAGLRDVLVPMERNSLRVELRGDELKDSPLLRNVFPPGQIVYVDARVGTPLADVSAYKAQIPRTIQEKLATAGTVAVISEGDIVVRDGARIDISGGSLSYLAGFVRTSTLMSQGRAIDIGEARPDVLYQGVADSFTFSSFKWGVSNTYTSVAPGTFFSGYREGLNAGSVSLIARAVVLDGAVSGQTVAGQYQREPAVVPLGGQVSFGNPNGGDSAVRNFWVGNAQFVAAPLKLDETFAFSNNGTLMPLPANRSATAFIPTAMFQSGGITRVEVFANGGITVPKSSPVSIAPGGSLSLTARSVEIAGDITIPGGSISATTRETVLASDDAMDYTLSLGAGARLRTAGTWTNDAFPAGSSLSAPITLSGGSVKLASLADLTIAAGSVIDASGGGWVDQTGKLTSGKGGSISLSTGRFKSGEADFTSAVLALEGELYSYGIAQGGALSLITSSIAFGSAAGALPGQLTLDPGFVRRGGFSKYAFSGIDGITVQADVVLAPVAHNLVPRAAFVVAPTGTDVRSISDVSLLPVPLRTAASITLSATSAYFGQLAVGQGAAVTVDPGGSIRLDASRQLTVDGRLEARGGSITLNTPAAATDKDFFSSNQTIWLGRSSQLISTGADQTYLQTVGRLRGEILDGGVVVINAGKGYVVVEQGARIDVSGSSGVVDVPVQQGLGIADVRRQIGSDGGTISISAREGMLLDGTFAAGGSLGSRGGSLSLNLVAYAPGFLRGNGGNFPDGTRLFVLSASGASIPTGLRPGDVVDANAFDPANSTLNGRAFVFADSLQSGRFDTIVLRGPDRDNEYGVLEVRGDVVLAAPRSIVLDVPVIRAEDDASLQLSAAIVTLANRSSGLQQLQPIAQGTGSLRVDAGQIQIIGNVALTQFDNVVLDSKGDIQGIGVLQGAFERRLAGSLRMAADLHLRASQVFPTTLAEFDFDTSTRPGSRIVVEQRSAPGPVLSAGGTLRFKAHSIEHGGTLKAPFGSIVLDATGTLDLLAGSVTSVSGRVGGPDGAVAIPFGTTEQNQRDYVYVLDSQRKLIFTTPPEKRVLLSAPDVNVSGAGTVVANGVSVERPAASIDVSGGGDLRSYEFIPGRGGSRDVLDRANDPDLYAILPWLAPGSSPYDHDAYRGSDGLAIDAAVSLNGVNGLVNGVYTLLPARYALLPGAFLVRKLEGTSDFLAMSSYALADGTQVVSGRSATPSGAGSYSFDSRTSAFEVVSGEIARTRSEYLETYASKFFANAPGAQLPGDAGTLSVTRADALVLGGILGTTHASGFRGAGLDLSIAKLALVSGGATESGFVNLDIGVIQRLGVSSVLIGGTRRRVDGSLQIDVGASELLIDTTSGGPLSAEEILLVANDSILIRRGSVIEATGSGERIGATQYLVKSANGNDDGALIRVANAAAPQVVRGNVARAAGSILAEEQTVLRGRSIILDATLSNVSKGLLDLGEKGALSLSAGLISLGDVGLVQEGLALGRQELAEFQGLESLQLKSYSSIDVYGAGSIGGGASAIALEGAGIRGFENANIVGLDSVAVADVSVPPGGLTPSTTFTGVQASMAQTQTQGAGMKVDVIVDASGKPAVSVVDTGQGYRDGDAVSFVVGNQSISVAVRAKTEIAGASVALGNLIGSASGPAPILSDGTSPSIGTGLLQLKTPSVVFGEVAGDREFAVSGYSDVMLRSSELVVRSRGRVTVVGDLTVESSRIAAQTSADYAINATGAFTTVGAAASGPLTPLGPGASLRVVASRIVHGGVIDLPAGYVSLEAIGAESGSDIELLAGSAIRAAAAKELFGDLAEERPAGTVELRTSNGRVSVAGVVDVSATSRGNAGTFRVVVPKGILTFDPTGARISGGVFQADLGSLSDFAGINGKLNDGGFGVAREFRVRSGNVRVGDGDVLTAESIRLAADNGSLAIDGKLNASGAKGGRIELFARRGDGTASGSILVGSTAVLDASANVPATSGAGSLGDGGKIFLSIIDADTVADTSARIDVRDGASILLGGLGLGTGGSLVLRAPRLSSGTDGVAISGLSGGIAGASEVVVEAFRVYEGSKVSSSGSTPGTFSFATTDAPYLQTQAFVNDYGSDIVDRLGSNVKVRPGIEIRSAGDLELTSDWNLCGASATCDTGWRFGGESIALTVRSVGSLKLLGSLSDGFSGAPVATGIAAGIIRDVPSAAFRLVAGADVDQARLSAVTAPQEDGRGSVELSAGKLIRTGKGDIDVAAATDIVFRDGGSTIYTAGVPTADPVGFLAIPSNVTGATVGGLTSRSAQFPDQGGDVSVAAGRNIKSTPSGQFVSEWLGRYAQRDSGGLLANPQTSWFIQFRDFQQGVGTLGGGDLRVVAGGNIEHLSVVAPTTGRLGGPTNEAPDLANLGIQGGGDFEVRSGGDVLGGFFLVDLGTGTIRAGGDVSAAATGATGLPAMRPVLALGDSSIDIYAAKDLEIQTVVDATAVPQLVRLETGTNNLSTFLHRYSSASGVNLRSGGGDVRLLNDREGVISSNTRQFGSRTAALTTYPGTVRAVAFGGDVALESSFSIFPAANGRTDFLAAESIAFAAGFEMLQSRLTGFPGVLNPTRTYVVDGVRPPTPIQGEDTEPLRIYALNGSISASGATLSLAKPALVLAGQDILDLPIATRHFRATDVTRIRAAGDVRYRIERDPDSGQLKSNSNSVTVEGPGRIEIIAGGGVDFGNSVGVVTRGNLADSTLPEGGASIFVLAGFNGDPKYEKFRDSYLAPGTETAEEYAESLVRYVSELTGTIGLTPEAAWVAFKNLPGDRQQTFLRDVYFAELRSAGRAASQGGGLSAYDRGNDAIETLFPAAQASQSRQDINLFFSQLKTEQGGGIDLINPSGLVNAGLATSGAQAKAPSDQGIVTLRGGSIRAAIEYDFLVNQSRVFTVGGGDILIWSSQGNIDAGKGAKTASATPPPVLIIDPNGGVKVDASSSISGSGIGVLLGREGIEPGDVDLVAPKGAVDAGDAGIRSAGNLTIAAVRVVGAENIQVGGVSAGVPVSAAGSFAGSLTSLGSVGAESVKAANSVAQQTAEAATEKQAKAFLPSFLKVEVIGLGDDDDRNR